MARYVVTYVWEETCYVEAETARQARDVAGSTATDPQGLDLAETRVRKASKLEQAIMLWPGAD